MRISFVVLESRINPVYFEVTLWCQPELTLKRRPASRPRLSSQELHCGAVIAAMLSQNLPNFNKMALAAKITVLNGLVYLSQKT